MIPTVFLATWNKKDDNSRSTVQLFFIAITAILLWHLLLVVVVLKKPAKGSRKTALPPGPRGLPIIGNILGLERNLHTCFARLSKKYGPIMSLKLGTRLCIVINSASVAEEIFRNHDTIFANRDPTVASYVGSWEATDLVWSPYGEHWRMLRKICVRELLSKSSLDALHDNRCREVRTTVKNIYSNVGTRIDIGDHMFQTMFRLMTNMLWSGTSEGEDMSLSAEEFQQTMDKIMVLLVEPNLSDLFPVLAMFDLQRVQKRMKNIRLSLEKKMELVLNRRLEMKDNSKIRDFLQVLLELKPYGDEKTPFESLQIKALLLDLLAGGTKSSSTTLEWAMTELMRQPNLLKKAQVEIEAVVGMNNIVKESHCSEFHYLHAVLKETLRLHQPAPLLFPRLPSESCILGGYLVPKGTKVMVNAWAIQRDPTYWDNPLEFQPERFMGSTSKFDFRGTNQKYTPFGFGKRVCPGIPMAERTLPYILASMLHSFNWELPEGTTVDLAETFGLELTKTTPLVAIPSQRLFHRHLYT